MNYQAQGEKFIKDNGIKFSTKFIKYGIHFDGDKESRDIFRVTFSRNGKRFSLRFGQSINDSTGNGDNPPTPYDVLACITKYEPETYENFISDFGYDEDSRRAEKTYKAVLKEWAKVSAFFSEKEIEALQEIN